jgi:hypothetical protein
MIRFVRQPTRSLRLWLIAAAAVLLLTSVLEAGHVHGVFSPTDDQCALCQHSVSLDNPLSTPAQIIIPLLATMLVLGPIESFIPSLNAHFALIRAPPKSLHTH